MARRVRHEVFRGDGYEIRTIGARPPGLRDLYHWLLRIPWWAMLGVIVIGYLGLNALFALGFVASGGVGNAASGSFADAFFFSVQTMGTIGYGGLLPTSTAANVLVVLESVTGLLVTALSTGLVFVRFSQTRARMVFAREATVSLMDGVPTLSIRLGNDRRTTIVDATFRLVLSTTTKLAEGSTFYRSQDLVLVRDRATALSRSWVVLHRLDAASPLHGVGPDELRAMDGELSLTVLGMDEVSMQPVHARHSWSPARITWGVRLADVLSETPDGNLILDLGRFHDTEPTPPTAAFPYHAGKRVPFGP